MRPAAWIHAAALASLCMAAPGAAQKSPDKIRLTPRSRDGAVLIRVPVEPFHYTLKFSKNGSSGFLSRAFLMEIAKARAPGYRYIARTLDPGRYRFDWLTQQRFFGACIESETIEFDVVAGRIAYVGTLRTDRLLEAIERKDILVSTTADSDASQSAFKVPPLEDRDDAGLRVAREFADRTMHGGGGLVELAQVRRVPLAPKPPGKESCG